VTKVVRKIIGKSPTANASSRALALIPVCVTIVFAALMLPRSATPGEVPVPKVDTRELARAEALDAQRVQDARIRPLSPSLILLGSAIRGHMRLEATPSSSQGELEMARVALNQALVRAGTDDGPEGLLRLRAVQTLRFLDAVTDFEATGVVSEELTDLGGDFVTRMRTIGWIEKHHLLMDEGALRSAYKTMWNQIVGADRIPALALTLDESRALYAFYISHPLAESRMVGVYEEQRKNAKTERECRQLDLAQANAREAWRLDKVKRIGALDPEYPTSFALGVSQYHLGKYPASAESFRGHLRAHPNGALSLLAQNYLRAAIREAELGQ
jgi:hypothetical protein